MPKCIEWLWMLLICNGDVYLCLRIESRPNVIFRIAQVIPTAGVWADEIELVEVGSGRDKINLL